MTPKLAQIPRLIEVPGPYANRGWHETGQPGPHCAQREHWGEHGYSGADGVSGSSVIGKNVAVGGQVGVADHCEIEDNAVIGAQAGIPSGKIVRTGQVVWGLPRGLFEKFKKQFAWFRPPAGAGGTGERLESPYSYKKRMSGRGPLNTKGLSSGLTELQSLLTHV